jgi:predicted Zn-dependent protease
MTWTPEQARALAQKILAMSKAPACEVSLSLQAQGNTRFAANDVTTAGMSENLSITITSIDGGRSGTITADTLDDSGLREAVARSEALLATARPNPEAVEPLGPQDYPAIAAFDPATADASPIVRSRGVKIALDRARGRGLDASGFFETGARWSAIANSKGNFGFHRATEAGYSATMRTSDGTGSGYAAVDAPRLSAVDAAALAERAAVKAETSAKPRDLPPGEYPVILEPQAVADLLGMILFSFDTRSAEEGRSYFSKPGGGTRLGEKIFADKVTLRSDPTNPLVPGLPWAGGGGGGGGGMGFFGGGGGGGLPTRKTTWIENGVVRNLTCDRYWAKKTGRDPLPFSGSLVMEGGSGTLDDLIAQTERALLVTRFWYIRAVNPREGLVTGLTRDGVWLVEKGKIAHPVNNFRFNDGPINLLKNVEAMSASVPVGSDGFSRTMLLPAIRASKFLFTSKSDAV